MTTFELRDGDWMRPLPDPYIGMFYMSCPDCRKRFWCLRGKQLVDAWNRFDAHYRVDHLTVPDLLESAWRLMAAVRLGLAEPAIWPEMADRWRDRYLRYLAAIGPALRGTPGQSLPPIEDGDTDKPKSSPWGPGRNSEAN